MVIRLSVVRARVRRTGGGADRPKPAVRRPTPGRRVRPTPGLFAAVLVGLLAAPAKAEDEADRPEKFVFDAVRFGSPIQVQLYAPDAATAKSAAEAAFAEAKRLDRVFSDYHPDSEARRLTAKPGPPEEVSADLYRLLSFAEAAREETDGAFDVTLGPLSHLWRKARRFSRLPAADDLAAAKAASGPGGVVLRTTGLVTNPRRLVEVTRPGVRLDFGGVAKGYAVDRMVEILRSQGATSCLVDAGGDIRVSGRRPDKRPWVIEVASAAGQDPARVTLTRTAVATSGDSEQYAEIEGRRYSHILDPRSKTPLERRPQVTVIASTAAAADALASAFSVLGAERSLEWLENYRWSGRDTFGRTILVRFQDAGDATVDPVWERAFRRRGGRGGEKPRPDARVEPKATAEKAVDGAAAAE